jgi:hypothetical protein
MTRGRSRKRHCSSRKSTDENDHSQTGQGEEIATPSAQCTNPRRGRPEELTEMNPSNPLQTEPKIVYYYNAASAVSPNAHHQDKKSSLFSIDHIAKPLPNAAQILEDHYFKEPEIQQSYFDCLTWAWHREILQGGPPSPPLTQRRLCCPVLSHGRCHYKELSPPFQGEGS